MEKLLTLIRHLQMRAEKEEKPWAIYFVDGEAIPMHKKPEATLKTWLEALDDRVVEDMADMVFIAFEQQEDDCITSIFMSLAAGIAAPPNMLQNFIVLPRYSALIKSMAQGGLIQ